MKLKPLKTNRDYQQALKRLEVIFDSKKGTAEGDEPEKLGVLIGAYENKHLPVNSIKSFQVLLNKLRSKTEGLSLDEITKEVEIVRTKRTR